MPLSGSVVLITGATGPVGRPIADAFCEAGASVAFSVRRIEDVRPAEVSLRKDGKAPFIAPCDLRFEEDVVRLVHRVIRHFGRIDMLINAAMISGPTERIVDCHVDPWRKLIATNLTGSYLLCREVLPWMLRQKRGCVALIHPAAAEASGASTLVTKEAVSALVNQLTAEIRLPDVNLHALPSPPPAKLDDSAWLASLLELAPRPAPSGPQAVS